MRPVFIILIVSLVVLQHKLWLGDGNLIQWHNLEKKLAAHEQENNKLATRNRALEADIRELKNGDQALEEQARYELGMIKGTEVYYQFID
ncbi:MULTISPECIES: cell division protein FtsB [Legionella]|uniref:Cell division protein FtsB n=1 Tax=Legionella resiliens TaxID=2905958 RepID=A0ABS8X7H1_9GAMM|nr:MULTISPECIES: cell division protein FtsB [unclassified Legionella]MCE0724319.1 cell division protein FtsB [Legionella sp. 9fVS26]MCE3533471.1 cell division protein FtsB [Legionella sp. 8cVS16]QLZ69656.1 cell division protein FtsB [Legionella sp. PC1000]